MYLGVYGFLGVSSSIIQGIAFALLTICALSASTNLHEKMLKSVLRAPMSFFDTNPKGRIINRFAKDMDYMDKKIYWRKSVASRRMEIHIYRSKPQ